MEGWVRVLGHARVVYIIVGSNAFWGWWPILPGSWGLGIGIEEAQVCREDCFFATSALPWDRRLWGLFSPIKVSLNGPVQDGGRAAEGLSCEDMCIDPSCRLGSLEPQSLHRLCSYHLGHSCLLIWSTSPLWTLLWLITRGWLRIWRCGRAPRLGGAC